MTEPTTAGDDSHPPFPWLTGEIAVYGLIVGLALALRLGGLETRIMDVPEAEQAWQAWRLASGDAPTGSYSPLLLSAQALFFVLFGASDFTARLLPALAGSAMAVLPYFVRSYLGRVGALTAALALALSPTLVYSARYGDGTALLLACTLGLMVLWLAYQWERRRAYLHAIAALGAFALLADPRVVGVAIVLALAWAVERFLFGRNWLEAGEGPAIPWRQLGLTFGVTLVLGATAFAFNPGGLGAWADYPAGWGRHLAPVVNGQPWYYPLLALILYEPFLLLFGLIGAVGLLVRRSDAPQRQIVPLIWMAGGFTLLALLTGGRSAGDVALICAPLALLAGRVVEDLVESWEEGALWTREGILALVVLGILIYVALQTAFYARSVYLGLPQATQFLWFWLLAVALLIVLVGFSVAWFGIGVAWRATGGVLAIVLILSAFSATTGLNYRRANDPRELHILAASDEGARDALEVMDDLSYHRWGYPTAMPVTVEAGLGPLWPWYLRDWKEVTFVNELTSEVVTPMVLSSEEHAGPAQSGGWNPSERYIGQDFVTRAWWGPGQLQTNDQLSWWLYRKSVNKPIPIQRVILWIQAEENGE